MNKTTSSVVAVAAALTGVLALSGAALAAPASPAVFARPADCPVNHSCYYDGQNGSGPLFVAPSCGFFNFGTMTPPLNDRIESIYNGGGAALQPYNWTGSWTPVGPAIGVNTGVNYTGGFANIIDAVQVC
jgi:hypothetical protein